jgi:UDP-3-O-[3-hydroxymyristoyl] glucosamine N-acyltransferase
MSERGRRVAGRVLFDAVAAVVCWVIVGVPAVAAGGLVRWLGWLPMVPWWHWAAAPLLVPLFLVGLVFTAGVLRILLPRPRPGRYPFPWHPQSVVWLLHFAVQRFMYLPLWRHFLFSFSTLRWMLLRALGCRSAFDIDTGSDVQVLDPCLVELGPGVMIGAGSMLAAHAVEGRTLYLGRIVLGEGVQVANNAGIGPGVTIGEYTVIGPECRIGADSSFGPFAHLGAACLVSPGARVGAHAVVGHQVSIERDVTVGEGAVVGSGIRVARGTVIERGARHPGERREVAI